MSDHPGVGGYIWQVATGYRPWFNRRFGPEDMDEYTYMPWVLNLPSNSPTEG